MFSIIIKKYLHVEYTLSVFFNVFVGVFVGFVLHSLRRIEAGLVSYSTRRNRCKFSFGGVHIINVEKIFISIHEHINIMSKKLCTYTYKNKLKVKKKKIGN